MSAHSAMVRRRGYMLGVLTALSAMNQFDRQLMSILIEPVRREFGLGDVQIGLLTGLAFATLYSVLSVPAALYAVDRSRRRLLFVSALAWGAATALCGAAQSFVQLLVARLGVGIGEAGGMPPSHAMISEAYPPGERATALGIWSAGINIGIFFAFLVGGYVGHRFGWRMAFASAGGATVLLALLCRFTVPEGPRAPAMRRPGSLLGSTVRAMIGDAAARQVCIGATLTAIVGYAVLIWSSSYLVRSHGMTIATAGAYLAVAIGIGGALGTWSGARLSDRMRRRDVRWSLWVVAVVLVAIKPFAVGFLLAGDLAVALGLFVVPAALATIYIGPSIAVLHNRLAPEQRPLASALFLMLVNLCGFGLGPLLVGMMSQWAFAAQGPQSLRYALAVMQIVGLWGALHFYLAGRRLADQPAENAARA